MNLRKIACLTVVVASVCTAAYSQNLSGKNYDPATDPDIDMFISGWTQSMPRNTHGSLIERDILTKGDHLKPPRKGAVLKYVNRFCHASLDAGFTTVPTVLDGEQEAFYVISGAGEVSGGGKTYKLFHGASFLAPEGLEFTITNTGDEELTMFLVSEPTYEGFVPRKDIYYATEASTPFNSVVGHWCYQEKDLLLKHHGFATLHAVITLTLDPMTIGHPHFHGNDMEEVWTTIYGDNIAWLGTELRPQPAGTAYMIPPDGATNHSNINQAETGQVKMLYFAVRPK